MLVFCVNSILIYPVHFVQIRKDFLDYLRVEGDQSITLIVSKLCDDFYKMINEDYAKHVKSVLFTKINAISQVSHNVHITVIIFVVRRQINEVPKSMIGYNPYWRKYIHQCGRSSTNL
jgi:hypothetical protein